MKIEFSFNLQIDDEEYIDENEEFLTEEDNARSILPKEVINFLNDFF